MRRLANLRYQSGQITYDACELREQQAWPLNRKCLDEQLEEVVRYLDLVVVDQSSVVEVHWTFVVGLVHMDLIVLEPEADPVHMGSMVFSSSETARLVVEEK